MKTAGVLLALAGALALQTTLAGLTIGGGGTAVNLVLVAVVYAALAFGPVPGLLAGSAGGLAQDALAGGIIGIGGLSKTIVGFFVGVLGAQFIVAQTLPRLVMFVGATIVHELCFQSLYALVEARTFSLRWVPLLMQAGANGVVGIIAFKIVELGPGLLQRRDDRRNTIGRRRY
jgi:rod shape-determining protein MreD